MTAPRSTGSQLRIPLPQVPTGLDSEVENYLQRLKTAVEANMNLLFATGEIHGARIIEDTVTTSTVDFVVLGTTNVIASINASSEGINIEADNIAIAGTTTFTSGWAAATNAESTINVLNTTNAPAVAGATDDTAADTAQSAANTNKSKLDDWTKAGETTIDGGKIYAGSSITVGSATKSGTITIRGAAGQGDAVIRSDIAGSVTDFGLANPGFIMGMDDSDSDAYKLEVGSSTKHIKWDGTDLIVNGVEFTIGNTGSSEDMNLEINSTNKYLRSQKISGGTYLTSKYDQEKFTAWLHPTEWSTTDSYRTMEITFNTGSIKGGNFVSDLGYYNIYKIGGAWAGGYAGTNVAAFELGSLHVYKYQAGGITIGTSDKMVDLGGVSGTLGLDTDTKITYNSTGVVAVPSAALTGTIDNARIPNLSTKTLTGCDCTNQLGLFAGTAAEVKALTGAVTGDIAFATDKGGNGMIVYCDTSNVWRKANTQEAI